jgi:hypothetical protein
MPATITRVAPIHRKATKPAVPKLMDPISIGRLHLTTLQVAIKMGCLPHYYTGWWLTYPYDKY